MIRNAVLLFAQGILEMILRRLADQATNSYAIQAQP